MDNMNFKDSLEGDQVDGEVDVGGDLVCKMFTKGRSGEERGRKQGLAQWEKVRHDDRCG